MLEGARHVAAKIKCYHSRPGFTDLFVGLPLRHHAGASTQPHVFDSEIFERFRSRWIDARVNARVWSESRHAKSEIGNLGSHRFTAALPQHGDGSTFQFLDYRVRGLGFDGHEQIGVEREPVLVTHSRSGFHDPTPVSLVSFRRTAAHFSHCRKAMSGA